MPLKVLNLSRTKKLQIKLLQKPSQQLLPSNTLINDTDDNDGPEILDFHCAYSCPKVARKVMDFDDDKPLSDSVTSKLAVAREQAIQKYREIYIQV
jgi:hypothetical protein